SPKYLALVWSALTEGDAEVGPLAALRKLWDELPSAERADPPRPRCERMRDLVVRLRQQLKPNVKKVSVNGISAGSQPLVLWHNPQLASRHRSYSGEITPDLRKMAEQLKGADAELEKLFAVKVTDADSAKVRESLERFCSVFPDSFVVSDRGPYFDPAAA